MAVRYATPSGMKKRPLEAGQYEGVERRPARMMSVETMRSALRSEAISRSRAVDARGCHDPVLAAGG